MRILKLLAFGIVLTSILSSCGINSNLMLKTPKGFVFDSIPMNPLQEYKLAPNDIVDFQLFANDGFKVIDLSAGTGLQGESQVNFRQNLISYTIRPDSSARLPMLGDVKLAGYTRLEAELKLQENYAKFYVDPYVQLNIKNQRVIVFPGNGADARVIKINNNNTTLLEVIAQAGGVPERGRSNRVKIIRQVGAEKEIYQVDMSTVGEGIKYVNMIMQANDIIYVEPVPEISRGLVREIAPILSLVSSAFVIYITVQNIR